MPGTGPIKLVYFYSVGCASCREVKPLIDELQELYPDAEIRHVELRGEALGLNEVLCKRANIPEKNRGIAPSVFSAKRGLVGKDITRDSLKDLAESARGLPAPWILDAQSVREGEHALETKFKGLTLAMVVGGGLGDSINPCAIGVLVFFVTYMTFVGKSKSEIALAGAVYTGAVFVTYFAIGLGLYHLIGFTRERAETAQRILGVLMAGVLLVLAFLSLADGVKCLRGEAEKVSLKLPDKLKKRVNLLIAQRTRLGLTVGATLLMGGVVALIEFPCTGQLYIPVIYALESAESHRLAALGWLVLYNLLFILPLVAIFLCVFFGMTSQQLTAFFQRHLAKTKFAMAALFMGLFVVILLTVLKAPA